MSANESRPSAKEAATHIQLLHPQPSIALTASSGDTSAWRRFVDRDLSAAFRSWRHLYARGLTSPLVCAALFSRWGLCACGRCLAETHGGDR